MCNIRDVRPENVVQINDLMNVTKNGNVQSGSHQGVIAHLIGISKSSLCELIRLQH